MGNFYRCVYIPMPKLPNSVELRALMATPSDRFGQMEGFSERKAWKMYDQRQKEIAKWGRWLINRFDKKSGKGERSLLWHGMRKPLAGLKQEGVPTVIYVHCHGNAEVVGFRPLSLSPEQLATRLHHDGLDPTDDTLRIKLWSCHSGEVHLGADQSFTQRVATTLEGLEYYDLEIFGYVGTLTVGRGKHKKATGPDGRSKRPSKSRYSVRTRSAPEPSEPDDDDLDVFV